MNINDLIGRPFKYGGRDLSGFDCWGLCIEVSKRAGIFLPDINTPNSASMRGKTFLIARDKIFQRLEKVESFCLVAFELRPGLWHAGVVLEDCWHFIHIARKRAVVIERLDTIYWKSKFRGFYQLAK